MKLLKKILMCALAATMLGAFISCKTEDKDNTPMLLALAASNNSNAEFTLTGTTYYINYEGILPDGQTMSIFVNFADNGEFYYGTITNGEALLSEIGTYTKTDTGYDITITKKINDDAAWAGQIKYDDCNENRTATFTDDTKKSVIYNTLTYTKE